MLWGAFQTLQVVLAMPLLAVFTPANVIVVFSGFSNVINLDLIDKQTMYDYTIGHFVPSRVIESGDSFRLLKAQQSDTSEVETLGYAE